MRASRNTLVTLPCVVVNLDVHAMDLRRAASAAYDDWMQRVTAQGLQESRATPASSTVKRQIEFMLRHRIEYAVLDMWFGRLSFKLVSPQCFFSCPAPDLPPVEMAAR